MNSRSIVFAVAAICLAGCTSMRPMDARTTDLASELDVHDRVIVYEKSGRILDMEYRDIQDGEIRGWATDGSGTVSARVDDIERLEIEKIDGVKTTLAVVGGSALALVAVAAIAVVGATAVLAGP